ncbi:GNAT family N-acetyltransferase [Sansalvadorimonas sp. 2012CJ34-2]|uniref:GNAT family N-acetyltransferase n=1 Tax=Parendozoicomonas callyspongiae TaxID=2942213 RepID=A0ABT0PDA0_9GAMM|nr:GNAT family N-acetyltransferase [Sansalvadorimonas sp. 2012CJ34-2]MCL6269357.1 GNAT family N-acetyltransferase [Sansalvadorimonas sp. 2012CJ34-2]
MKRIRLRNLKESDKDNVFDLVQNPEVMRFIGPRRALTDDEAQAWFTEQLTRPSRRVVATCDTNELIGFCGMKILEGVPEFGYFLRHKFWQQGYATEACRMVLQQLNLTIDISTLQTFIANDNTASIALARKLNWKKLSATEQHGEQGHFYQLCIE